LERPLILLAFAAFAQSANLAMREELYNGSSTWQGKLAVPQKRLPQTLTVRGLLFQNETPRLLPSLPRNVDF
jgi:hypothetical protein